MPNRIYFLWKHIYFIKIYKFVVKCAHRGRSCTNNQLIFRAHSRQKRVIRILIRSIPARNRTLFLLDHLASIRPSPEMWCICFYWKMGPDTLCVMSHVVRGMGFEHLKIQFEFVIHFAPCRTISKIYICFDAFDTRVYVCVALAFTLKFRAQMN